MSLMCCNNIIESSGVLELDDPLHQRLCTLPRKRNIETSIGMFYNTSRIYSVYSVSFINDIKLTLMLN